MRSHRRFICETFAQLIRYRSQLHVATDRCSAAYPMPCILESSICFTSATQTLALLRTALSPFARDDARSTGDTFMEASASSRPCGEHAQQVVGILGHKELLPEVDQKIIQGLKAKLLPGLRANIFTLIHLKVCATCHAASSGKQ